MARLPDYIKIDVQGVEYVCPKTPPIDSTRGSHLPKKDQVWYRREEHDRWSWNQDPDDGEVWYNDPATGQMEWYKEELHRIENGDWIMINGTPTWFNKYCYQFHQWFVLQEGIFPTYKETSLEFFRFYELNEIDPRVLGECGIKGRRVGLSSMKSCIQLFIGLTESNTLQGIVSKTGRDAEEMYLMIKNGLENLPLFLIPELNKVTDSEIHIAKKQAKISKNNKTVSSDKGKNNRINWLATAENAYDSSRVRDVTIDECLAPDTKILCAGYGFKPVKDINVGDYVIVEGGAKKRVAKKFIGKDEMFLIRQPYSKDYIVSSKHRLYLEQRCKVNTIYDDGIKKITPVEFINLGKYRKRTTHGLRSEGIEFPEIENMIDPYVFGAWIGDGDYDNFSFTVNIEDDKELLDYLIEYGKALDYRLNHTEPSHCTKVRRIFFTRHVRTSKNNPLLDELKRLNVYKNKHIPEEYLYNSRENRLQLLAGIIDTDGYCNYKRGDLQICLSKENIINDIYFLARSLGFSTSEVRYKKTNFEGCHSYCISISGDLSQIPTKILRKQFNDYVQKSKFRRNRIEVESIGIGDYVGIQVETENDDDRRLILEDFTLTMNCAKWEKVNVQICLKKISETLVVGSSVGGHVSAFSSVNKGDKGGDNFRAIWDASDHLGKLDKFGRTATKLRRFFMAGYRGLNGYVGKYGESVIDTPTKEQSEYLASVIDPTTGKPACLDPKVGAREFLEESRRMNASDPEAYQEVVRMYPFEWKEVFRDANNNCHFNLEDLNNQIERVETMVEGLGRNINTGENGRRGWFKKNDSGSVYFSDAPDGMWYILELLKPEDANKWVMKNGVKCPNNTAYGAAGLDSYMNSRQTVDKGSDACLMIHKRYNALNPESSGMPTAMFLGKPKTKGEFHQQIFYGLEYFGIRMLAERAPTDWEDYAITNGYASPLDVKKKHGYLMVTQRADGSDIYGIAAQNTLAREQHLTEQIEYALNNMHKILFLRLLRDKIDANIKDRTDYDAFMANGYALMGLKEGGQAIVPRETNVQYIKTYNLNKRR